MHDRNFLRCEGDSKHDKALLSVMTFMIESNPNANVTMAQNCFITVEGDGLFPFLEALVNQVPVLDMKVYKIKKSNKNSKFRRVKHETVDNGLEKFGVYFKFHELDYRKRMNIPHSEAVHL